MSGLVIFWVLVFGLFFLFLIAAFGRSGVFSFFLFFLLLLCFLLGRDAAFEKPSEMLQRPLWQRLFFFFSFSILPFGRVQRKGGKNLNVINTRLNTHLRATGQLEAGEGLLPTWL